MQNNMFELDFSEIDINNPFSITECTMSPHRKNSGSSLTDSVPHPYDSHFDINETPVRYRKNSRGRKVDDFDYNSKIQEELDKMGDEAKDPSLKRKLIQKIRNRLSANRSRFRSKVQMQNLCNENKALKKVNKELQEELENITNENKKLVKKLFKNNTVDSSPVVEIEEVPIKREEPKSEINYFKNMFFITAILLTFVLLPTGSDDKVKIGGAVPLLSLKKPISKIRNATIRELCNRNGLSNKSCITPKRYLYKLKQRINGYKPKQTNTNTLPQYKIKDLMNEVVSYSCYNQDDKLHNEERVFLFDKELLENINSNKELHYVSEALPIEHINN